MADGRVHSPATAVSALTPTEQLAAAGRSDREIAEILYLSVRGHREAVARK
jgi:DNA-binding CsgD family transcriptional regulator